MGTQNPSNEGKNILDPTAEKADHNSTQAAEDLWFLMHHSDDPDRRAMAVTCYCDDSGSHEESKVVVVGGWLMNKGSFLKFDTQWNRLLREFRIDGIHMRDFVTCYGRYITIPHEMKLALFRSATELINHYKIYSLTVSIPQVDFKSLLSMKIYREIMGPYAMAFFATVLTNVAVAKQTEYSNRIAYLIDKGSQHHHEQMDAAHSVVLAWERTRGEPSRTGVLASDLDDNNNALQAADVIAWAYHRKMEFEANYGDEFKPLLDIFKDGFTVNTGLKPHPHVRLDIPLEGIKIFADGINAWIAENGEMPESFFQTAFSPPRRKAI